MGFVNSVVLVLQRRLQAQRDQIWETILNVRGLEGWAMGIVAGGLTGVGRSCGATRLRRGM